MSRQRVGLQTEAGQHAPGGQRGGAESRLGDGGVAERQFLLFLLLRLPRRLREHQRGDLPAFEGGIRLGEGVECLGERADEVARHADVLRSLAGEEDAQLSGLAGAVEDSVDKRGLEGLGLFGESLPIRAALESDHKARIRRGIERSARRLTSGADLIPGLGGREQGQSTRNVAGHGEQLVLGVPVGLRLR